MSTSGRLEVGRQNYLEVRTGEIQFFWVSFSLLTIYNMTFSGKSSVSNFGHDFMILQLEFRQRAEVKALKHQAG